MSPVSRRLRNDRAPQASRGEEGADQGVLVLGVDHIRAEAARLGPHRARHRQWNRGLTSDARGGQAGPGSSLRQNGKRTTATPSPLLARGRAVVRGHHGSPGARGRPALRPGARCYHGASPRNEGRIVLRREHDLHSNRAHRDRTRASPPDARSARRRRIRLSPAYSAQGEAPPVRSIRPMSGVSYTAGCRSDDPEPVPSELCLQLRRACTRSCDPGSE